MRAGARSGFSTPVVVGVGESSRSRFRVGGRILQDQFGTVAGLAAFRGSCPGACGSVEHPV